MPTKTLLVRYLRLKLSKYCALLKHHAAFDMEYVQYSTVQ